jgi:CHASE2 domain-containing sensor protein
VVDQLPQSVQDKIPNSLLDLASSNPKFAAVLAVIGVLAVVGFVFSIFKSAIKMAIFWGLVAAGAWFFFFQQ